MPADAAARKKKTTKKKATPAAQTVKATVTTPAETADSTLQQSMTLERDFAPIVRDADKMQSHPTVEQPTLQQRSLISFADWTAQPESSTDLTRLKVGRVFDDEPFETNRGYVDFRIGNYWNTDLKAGYNLIDTEATELKLSTEWHATEQDIKSTRENALYGNRLGDWYQSYLSGAGALELTRRRERLDWHMGVGYKGVSHTLLGNNLRSSALAGNNGHDANNSELRQKTSDVNFRLSFDNERHDADVKYEVGTETYLFSYDIPEENRETQERFWANVSAPSPLEELRAGLKAEVELRQYNKSSWTVNDRDCEALEEGVAVRLTPYVQWELDELHLDLGARADFLSDAKHHVGIAPEVHASYELPFKGQYLYADLTGGVESPSVRTLMYQMPFYLPIEEHLNPWTVTDATVGYSNKVCGSLRGRVFLGAAYTLDALVAYATDGLTVGRDTEDNEACTVGNVGVTTTLGNVDDLQLKAGLELEWTASKYFYGTLGATIYDHSEACAASQRANKVVDVALRSHPVKQLEMELRYEGKFDRNAWYLNPTTAGTEKIEMENINDLSLSGSWAFTKDFSVRADIRNLLNEEQESWLGAPGQRFNFQVGLLWKF
jgi:hypothetical protein